MVNLPNIEDEDQKVLPKLLEEKNQDFSYFIILLRLLTKINIQKLMYLKKYFNCLINFYSFVFHYKHKLLIKNITKQNKQTLLQKLHQK